MIRKFGRKRATVKLLFGGAVVLTFLLPWRSTTISTPSFQDVVFHSIETVNTQSVSERAIYNAIGPDKNRHCFRPCHPSIPNRIVYTCLHPAGLLDRQELLDNLLELAAFLCATLEFPTPTQSFHPMHNHQRPVDDTLNWSDFFDFSLVDMDMEYGPSQSSRYNNSTIHPMLVKTVKVTMDPSFYLPWKQKPHCRRPRAAPDRNRDPYGMHVLSKSRDEVLHDFDTIRRYSFAAETLAPFLWEIPTNYYAFHKELRAHLRALPNKGGDFGAACIPWSGSGHYARRTFPPHLEGLIRDVWTLIGGESRRTARDEESSSISTTIATSATPSPLIGFLHIRRGDTMDECDTSIDKLKSYLSCSLSNMTFAESSSGVQDSETNSEHQQLELPVKLLVGTNEENLSYMQTLEKMIDELHLHTMYRNKKVHLKLQAGDMERLIWDHLQSQVDIGRLSSAYLNNLHVFQILEHIMNHLVDFKLVQRRFRYCNDCDPVVIRRSILAG
jgi:hypothetical protein